jgi:lipopolysaccharide transport protein LptA
LLHSAAGSVDATSGIFVADEAIHFVSDRLESRAGGQYLVFSGTVRGWQGERNLSADTLTINQRAGTLAARENVTARFPRATSLTGGAEAHYIQITSGELDYGRAAAVAVFSENVRVRLVEGWVEADRIEIALTGEGGEIQRIEADGDVRLEFRQEVDDGVPNLVTGNCDRLIYIPSEETLRLIGEDAPASVRRIGQEEGTTTGRVLRYHIVQGTLEVDSGDQGAATIRTGK